MPLEVEAIRGLCRLSSPFILTLLLILSSQALEERQPVPAKDILEKLGSPKPVSYRSAVIVGDLAHDGPIASPITIVDCVIEGDVRFDGAILQRMVNFEKTRFNGSASFNGARFLGYANFSQCEFHGPASFRGTSFRGPTSFWRSVFAEFSTFRRAVFDGAQADFHMARFQGDASFNFASFPADKADFEEARFDGLANFQQAVFDGEAIFLGSTFHGPADFSKSRFNTTSKFIGSRFFRQLYLEDVEYKVFDITWESIRYRLVCDEPGYIELIKNFRTLGLFDDADSCYYQYRDWKRINRPAYEWGGVLWDTLSWITCGYGVRWTHTVLTGIAIILIFGIYFGLSESRRVMRDYLSGQISVGALAWGLRREIHSTALLSVICLLSLPGEMYPYGRIAYAKFLRRHFFAVVLERILGWGLMLILIGVISRMIVRY